GSVVLMRELDLSIRIPELALGDAEQIEACAHDVVRFVVHRAGAGTPAALSPPPPHDDVIVFASDAHWRAAYVATVAGAGRPSAWYFDALRAEGSPQELVTTADLPALLQ